MIKNTYFNITKQHVFFILILYEKKTKYNTINFYQKTCFKVYKYKKIPIIEMCILPVIGSLFKKSYNSETKMIMYIPVTTWSLNWHYLNLLQYVFIYLKEKNWFMNEMALMSYFILDLKLVSPFCRKTTFINKTKSFQIYFWNYHQNLITLNHSRLFMDASFKFIKVIKNAAVKSYVLYLV